MSHENRSWHAWLAGLGWRCVVRELLLVAAIVVMSTPVLRGQAISQPFSIDESRWIATSRYFWTTFVDRDIFGDAWQPSYIVYTHPPVARYVIGFGLWLQGWSPDRLNDRYDSLETRFWNEREGNVPGDDLLQAARRVTLVFAVASVVLLYSIGRQLGGRVAGLATVALTLVSPLLTAVWTRALAESIVAAFGLLTLSLAIAVMPRAASLGRWAWLPLGVGAALALAAATKLNGGIVALGLGAYALVQQSSAVAQTGRTRGLRAWIDLAMMAVILFVAVNPLLYRFPVERAINLIRHRQDEMEFQRSVFTRQALPDDLRSRVARVGERTFDTLATPAGPLPLSPDVVLVSIGLGLLAWRAYGELRRRAPGPALLFLCTVVATYLVITPNLGFDSTHYYAPLVTLNMVVGGIALAAGLGLAWRTLASLLRRGRRPAQNVQVPST